MAEKKKKRKKRRLLENSYAEKKVIFIHIGEQSLDTSNVEEANQVKLNCKLKTGRYETPLFQAYTIWI